LAVAAVSNDQAYVHGLFEQVVKWVESSHLPVELVDWQVEMV
jgi:hypothetical protein